ncbi:hypothetical protein MHYP_G00358370 [Metynnis hypsauchen]
MEAAEATDKMKTSDEKPLQKHLNHLESSDEVVKAICELLEVLFEDVLSASVQPLAENEMISKVAAEAEAEAEAIDGLISASVKDEKEEQLDEPLDHLVRSDGVVKATCELLDIQLENPASVQPLENEAVMMTEAAEGTDKMKSICLKSSEEKPLQKHLDHLESSDEVVKAICELLEVLFEDVLSASVQPLAENEMISKVAAEAEAEAEAIDGLISASVKDEKEEQLDEPLDHLESSDEVVKAICELLEVLFEDVLSASVQPLENEMISKVAAEAEAEAEAIDALISASVKEDKEEQLDEPLDHLVRSDGVVKATCELLDIQLENPASVQPLEKEMISKVAAEAESEAEAIDALISASVKDEKEEQLDEPLDHLVSSDDIVKAICELLNIQLENPASVQPLENEAVIMTEVYAAQAEAKDDLTFFATEASKDLLVTSLEDIEEETEEKPEEKPLEKDVICTTDAEAQPEATTDTPNVYLEVEVVDSSQRQPTSD